MAAQPDDVLLRAILQNVFDHFLANSGWPLARVVDLELGDRLDPAGGLQAVCRRAGAGLISCGSPDSNSDLCRLTLRGLSECSGSGEEVQRYVQLLRYCAKRYREGGGGPVTLSPADIERDFDIGDQEARRTSILLFDGAARVWTSASGADNDPRSFTLGVFSRRFSQVSTLQEVFDIVSTDESAKRATAMSTHQLPVPLPATGKIFLSHAAADFELAAFLRASLSGIEVFMASKAGDIPPGDDWLLAIQSELKSATSYLVLLTPQSVNRLWVWFETGAAWMSERRLIPVVAGGLRVEDVPYPIAAFQLLSLEFPDQAAVVFDALSAPLNDPAGFSTTMIRIGQRQLETLPGSDGWLGVQVDQRFYAWQGALDALQDRESAFADNALYQALKDAGMKPYHATRARLPSMISQGWSPVFLTDRRSWRRSVLGNNETILIVRPSSETA